MDFDPEAVAVLKVRAKAQIRARMRALRSAIPSGALHERSTRIRHWVAESNAFREARRIALFAPMVAKNEVDVGPLDELSRQLQKLVLYPRLEETTGVMSLRYATADQLEERGHGFAEPSEESPVGEPGADMLIVMPALAVGPDGHRVGYGGGYYDRLLSRMVPPASSMVVAFHFQLLAEVPATDGDQAAQWIITDAGMRSGC